ncbi:hypothetical protein [Methylacidimicrobium cyclopophantes]|nr:hypothetical protein [Methylacidimicrobium cyclopophantes]
MAARSFDPVIVLVNGERDLEETRAATCRLHRWPGIPIYVEVL